MVETFKMDAPVGEGLTGIATHKFEGKTLPASLGQLEKVLVSTAGRQLILADNVPPAEKFANGVADIHRELREIIGARVTATASETIANAPKRPEAGPKTQPGMAPNV